MNSVNNVARLTPEKITTPSADRLDAPGPVGENQRHRAHDGAERRHDHRPQANPRRLDDRVLELHALVAHLVDELDDQHAVLRRDADEHDDADLAVDVQRHARDPEAEQTARHRERHGHHDHERMHEALELRREHEEHDEQRDAEREVQRARGFLVLERLAAVVDLRGARQLACERCSRDSRAPSPSV